MTTTIKARDVRVNDSIEYEERSEGGALTIRRFTVVEIEELSTARRLFWNLRGYTYDVFDVSDEVTLLDRPVVEGEPIAPEDVRVGDSVELVETEDNRVTRVAFTVIHIKDPGPEPVFVYGSKTWEVDGPELDTEVILLHRPSDL